MDWQSADRSVTTNHEAIKRFGDRIAAVHPTGDYCDPDAPCPRCLPLWEGHRAAAARIDEVADAMFPRWLNRFMDLIGYVVVHGVVVPLHRLRHWLRDRFSKN